MIIYSYICIGYQMYVHDLANAREAFITDVVYSKEFSMGIDDAEYGDVFSSVRAER